MLDTLFDKFFVIFSGLATSQLFQYVLIGAAVTVCIGVLFTAIKLK